MPDNLIAVNLASYQRFRDGAWAHLERIRVRYVEIDVPAPDRLDAVRRQLGDYGLSVSSLQCPCDLNAEAKALCGPLEIGREMGVSLFFVSAKAGPALSKPDAYKRLRERAALADEYGITLSLETHPDLAENAIEARATLLATGHERVRWNLDTANLYYYNHNIEAADQAARGADLLASVHLKDTNGAHGGWWFPALGEGVVDFPAVFRVLNARGFFGPFTLEIEGIQNEALDEAATQDRVARSIRYLEAAGLVRDPNVV